MLALHEVLARFPTSKRHGKEYRTVCPVHGDAPEHPSLEITNGHTGIVFTCRTKGCQAADIIAAVGLTWADVLPDRAVPSDDLSEWAAIYDYRDASGALRYQVLRKATEPGEPKAFVQRHPDTNGGWVWKMTGVERLPYRLHELRGHARIFLCEGEKDVDRLWSIGVPATCNTGGAKKWGDGESAHIKAAGVQRVVLLPDNDADGQAHVERAALSLTTAGLTCLVLPAFDVPAKGDVSDWLDAGHTLTDLETMVRDHSSTTSGPIALAKLIGLNTMLHEPEDLTTWVVEDRIPAGSVCLLVAKPKVGKTTAARHLAVAIARGESWLGSQCATGLVWYLAFEGRKADHLSHFRQFNLSDDEAARIWCYMDTPRPSVLAELRTRAALEQPSLIIVDTLQRLLQVKSMDDYAEVTKAFDALIALVRETGAALLLLHHAGKAMDRDPLDSVLGSTAIAGSVDNTIVLAKLSGFRTVTTRQRIGPDLDECVIQLTPTGRVQLGGSRELAERHVVMKKIYEVVANSARPLPTPGITELINARKTDVLRALNQLIADGTLVRIGGGKPKDPFVYSVPSVPTVPSVPEPREPTQGRILEK